MIKSTLFADRKVRQGIEADTKQSFERVNIVPGDNYITGYRPSRSVGKPFSLLVDPAQTMYNGIIPCEPNTRYTISAAWTIVVFYDENNNMLSFKEINNVYSFTTPENCYGLCYHKKATSLSGIMIVKGDALPDTFTSYHTVKPRKWREPSNIPYGLASNNMINANGEYVTQEGMVCVYGGLNTVVGERYRISVKPGYAIQTVTKNKNNQNVTFWWYYGMIEIVADREITPIAIKKIDGTPISASNASSIGLKIEYLASRNKAGTYDCIVAAYNSSAADKAVADIICDGTNDEVELTCAINCNVTSGNNVRVLLLPGDYIIGGFPQCYGYDGIEGRGNVAILTMESFKNDKHYSVTMEGRYKEDKYRTSSTRIMVSQSAYNSIDTEGEYAIFGAFRKGEEDMGILYNQFDMNVKNFFVSVYGHEKPIVAIDGVGFTGQTCENVHITRGRSGVIDFPLYFDHQMPVPGLIGIRGTCGSNRGVGNYLKGCRIIGMYEAIALLGEHYIVQDCVEHSSVYGFTIGNYPVRTHMEHPNVFIGNSVEQCMRFAVLNRYGATEESENAGKPEMTLVYIGGSTEMYYRHSDNSSYQMQPLKEVIKGAYGGRFETDWTGFSCPVEKDGSGKYLEVVDYKNRVAGTTEQRPLPQNVAPNTKYYDTTLNKPIFCDGVKWYDYTGTEV